MMGAWHGRNLSWWTRCRRLLCCWRRGWRGGLLRCRCRRRGLVVRGLVVCFISFFLVLVLKRRREGGLTETAFSAYVAQRFGYAGSFGLDGGEHFDVVVFCANGVVLGGLGARRHVGSLFATFSVDGDCLGFRSGCVVFGCVRIRMRDWVSRNW
jgi:hypothetical protein